MSRSPEARRRRNRRWRQMTQRKRRKLCKDNGRVLVWHPPADADEGVIDLEMLEAQRDLLNEINHDDPAGDA